ncbi:hypothetical protein Tco_0691710 [Tanacetum coccineum]
MNFPLTSRFNNLSFLFICLVIGSHVKATSSSGYSSKCSGTLDNCLPAIAPAPAPTPEAPAPTPDGLNAEDIHSDSGIPPRIDCTNLCLDCTPCTPILMSEYWAASVWYCTCNGKIYIPHNP